MTQQEHAKAARLVDEWEFIGPRLESLARDLIDFWKPQPLKNGPVGKSVVGYEDEIGKLRRVLGENVNAALSSIASMVAPLRVQTERQTQEEKEAK